MGENSVPVLTNEFVSKLIGKKVKSFKITPGSAPGDNFMSILYKLEYILEENEENVIYAISKCYPAHPARQQFLNKTNTFWNELCVYKVWIPALKAFQAQHGLENKLPFAPLISGESVNFGTGKENDEMVKKYEGKVFSPFDIFVMMMDMKNTFGFRMIDRMIGLTIKEMSLVIQEYSKIHALSWAYKVKNGNEDLSDKFPFLKMDMKNEGMETWMTMMIACVQGAYDTLSGILKPEESGILKGFSAAISKQKEIMDWGAEYGSSILDGMLRVPLNKTEDEKIADDVPWKVLIHGDCWSNNFLFRYDPVTNKAVEVVLVDLQLMREVCPTGDLAYAIYSNTSPKFRQQYLKVLLRLYTDQFMFHCDSLGVPHLPGFSYDSLVRRFHRSKLFGFIMAAMVMNLGLKDAKAVDLESFKADMALEDMFDSASGASSDSDMTYTKRLLALAKEMYDDGII